MSNQNQRAVIVTGGSRGIGAAISKTLGANGYGVAVNFAVDETSARRVVEVLSALGSKAIAIRGDVSREEDVIELFETAERELGPLEALVNNAGITGGFSRVDAVDAGALARMLSVNVAGVRERASEECRRVMAAMGARS